MMKLRLVIFLLSFASIAYSMNYKILDADIDSVFVMRVKWNSEALYDPAFTCMYFEEDVNYVGYMLRKNTDDRIMRKLFKELKNLNEGREHIMDVRCKIHFYSSDTLAFTACVDEYRTLMDGCFYRTTKGLIKIIDKISDTHVLKTLNNRNSINKEWPKMIFGKDSLERYITKELIPLFKNIERSDTLKLGGIVRIDKSGKTKYVMMVQQSRLDNKIPKNVIDEFCNVFKNIIIWNPDNERTSYESIPIHINVILNPPSPENIQ